jgi:3-oxoacyl-[acyl-carrier-protein] synthase-3
MKTLGGLGRPARALVLAGDISTSKLLPGDRATVPLFGDAGSATALETEPEASPLHGVFGTDGQGAEHLIIRAGALRAPLLPPATPHPPELQERLYRDSRLHLNGTEVFNFTLRRVPGLIEAILAEAGAAKDDIDYFVMHQANAFMLTHLRLKAGLPEAKVPLALDRFGNTSSASIPLTIAARLAEAVLQRRRLVLMGFGVGWSWGAMQLDLGPIPAPRLVELG